jgi:hypothetical protein
MGNYDLNMNKKAISDNRLDQREADKLLKEKEMGGVNNNYIINKADPKIVNPYNPYIPYNNVIPNRPQPVVQNRPASALIPDNRPKTPVLQNNYGQRIGAVSPLNNYQRNMQQANNLNQPGINRNIVPSNNYNNKPIAIPQPRTPLSGRPQSAKNEIINKQINYNKPSSPKPNPIKYDIYNNKSPLRKDQSPLRAVPQNNIINRPLSSNQEKRPALEKINYVGGQQRLIGKVDVIPRAGIYNPGQNIKPQVGGYKSPVNNLPQKPMTPVVKSNNNNKVVPSYNGPKIAYVKK